ncbi:MAG: hypothetical protein QOJ95_1425 [Mycobacterium sp.]|nr:hypothetical protein [Mycobacterium sp.]
MSNQDTGTGSTPQPAPRPKPSGQEPAERRDIAAVLDELQAIRHILADIRDLMRSNQTDR